jgi:hypothetical protein
MKIEVRPGMYACIGGYAKNHGISIEEAACILTDLASKQFLSGNIYFPGYR